MPPHLSCAREEHNAAVLRLYDERESKRYQEGTNALLVLDEGDPALVDAVMSVVREECGSAPC